MHSRLLAISLIVMAAIACRSRDEAKDESQIKAAATAVATPIANGRLYISAMLLNPKAVPYVHLIECPAANAAQSCNNPSGEWDLPLEYLRLKLADVKDPATNAYIANLLQTAQRVAISAKSYTQYPAVAVLSNETKQPQAEREAYQFFKPELADVCSIASTRMDQYRPSGLPRNHALEYFVYTWGRENKLSCELLQTNFIYSPWNAVEQRGLGMLSFQANIRTLNINAYDGTKPEDYRYLSYLPDLESLMIAPPLKGFTANLNLGNFPKLKGLTISDINTDVGFLKNMPALTNLNLGHVTTDLKVLNLLPNPKQLTSLSFNLSELRDFSLLNVYPQLVKLSLDRNLLKDLTPLNNLKQLEKLSLNANSINDIRPVASLNRLTMLSLSQNQISDLTPLAGLTQLSYLNLNNNQIGDLSALAGLKQLTELFLYDNKEISDLTPLASLLELKRLDLGESKVTNLTPIAKLKNLKDLSIGFKHAIIADEAHCPLSPESRGVRDFCEKLRDPAN